MKSFLTSIILFAGGYAAMQAAPSILDIKHSIKDDNIIPPESFETKARELEEGFYLSNYAAGESSDSKPQKLGSPSEYEKRLSKLPTVIEMPYNSVVGQYIDMYVGKRRGLVSDLLALHSYYGNIFLEELEKQGMPTELQYLPVIESAINPNAVSRAGAAGLWQFMPGTAKGLGMEVNSLVDERRDPRSASRNAARYLKELYGIYGDWSLAVAAYNCGPGNVNKALRRAGGGKKDFWDIYCFLPAETRGYVPAFIAANYAMNYYKHHNISPRVITKHLVTDTVMVNKRVHFNQIAGVLNIPVDEIRMLNPQYRKDVIPGDVKPYPLVLPSQQVLSYVMSEPQIIAFDHDIYARRTYVEPNTSGVSDDLEFVDPGAIQPDMAQSLNATDNMELAQNFSDNVTQLTHTVAHGENLRDIAKKYGVSATDIKHWNNLRRGKVKEGDKLVIKTYEANMAMNASSSSAGSVTASSDVPLPPQKRSESISEVPRPNTKASDKNGSSSASPDAKASVPARRVYGAADEDAVGRPAAPSNATSSASGAATAANKSDKSASANNKVGNSKNSANGSTRKNSRADSKKKAAPKSKNYSVKAGDTLEKIAKRNGTTVAALQKANGIKGSNIKAGQTLKIPSGKK